MSDGSDTTNGGTAAGEIDSTADFRRVFDDALAAVPDEERDESRFVPGIGPLDAAVVLVGEAPGADEVESEAPFVGQAGGRLDSALEDLGVDRDELYVTNVVKVRPPGNRKPQVGEIEAWRPVLDAELHRISPAVVVPLGTTATQAVLERDDGITALHGRRFEGDDWVVVPAFHPAATFYDPSKVDDFEGDLRAAFEAV